MLLKLTARICRVKSKNDQSMNNNAQAANSPVAGSLAANSQSNSALLPSASGRLLYFVYHAQCGDGVGAFGIRRRRAVLTQAEADAQCQFFAHRYLQR
jgi:hypothetical protein